MVDFANKTALITGGRRGLGKAMALGLAENGADIAVVAKSPDADDLKRSIEQLGRKFFYVPVDLSDRNARKQVIPAVMEEMGHIDILINNAGIQEKAPLESYTDRQWDFDLSLMLSAVFELSREVSVSMIRKGAGKIINLASISSFQGARGIIGYATVKHAIVGLTKCLANELAPHGINVNAIAPGLFKTDMANEVFENQERAEIIRGRIPAGRFGEPADIVGPVLFLSSDMSRHVHGHVLLVDGGWMGR